MAAIIAALLLQQDRVRDAIDDLKAGDIEARIAAMRTLIELGASREVEPLLKSDDAEVRGRAERILATLRLLGSDPALKEAWRKQPDSIEDLAQEKGEPWIDWFRANRPENPRAVARLIVRHEKQRRALEKFIERGPVLETEDAWFCVEALGWATDHATATALRGLWPRLDQKEFLDALLDKMSDVRPDTRRAAGYALACVGLKGESIARAVRAALVRVDAGSAQLVERLAPDLPADVARSAVDRLLPALQARDTTLRAYVASALARLADPGTVARIVPALRARLADDTLNSRSAAGRALGACAPHLAAEARAELIDGLLAKMPAPGEKSS